MLQAQVVTSRPPRIKHDYVCVSCIYEPSDMGKHAAIYKRGKLRILLEPIALSLFRCPKCGRQHVEPNMFRSDERRRQRMRKHHRRVKNIKQIYH